MNLAQCFRFSKHSFDTKKKKEQSFYRIYNNSLLKVRKLRFRKFIECYTNNNSWCHNLHIEKPIQSLHLLHYLE